MSKELCASDLRQIMRVLYPDVEDGRDDDLAYEHPLTAIGVVLLSAAFLETVDAGSLSRFTRYSGHLISAINLNMQNNKLWTEGHYDTSAWLSPDGNIDERELWEHVEIATGSQWMPEGDTNISIDTCRVYWDEHRLRLPRTWSR
jgi:hypothetical protein